MHEDDISKLYAIFMKTWTYNDMEHLSPWRKEMGATAVKTEMVPLQYSGDPATR
jgi:hypothetical protein